MNNFKLRWILSCALIMGLLFWSSCNNDDDTTSIGDWIRDSDFEGFPRSGAIVFTVGSTAYVGLGYDGDDYLGDLYSYNINNGYWVKRASFPGTLRERAVSFSANGKGYVGLGYNRDLPTEELKDFWEYNPDTDVWTRLADFPGSARYNAIAFSIGSKGYVGTGYDGDRSNSDIFEFDANTNTWGGQIASYPKKIESGAAFVIGSTAYVCTGRNNGLYNKDLWAYSPEAGRWTELTPDDDSDYYDDYEDAVSRHDAVVLAVGSRVFFVGGSVGSSSRTVYEFNADTQVWDDRTSFEGAARTRAIGFVLDGRAFVGLGQSGSSYYDDIWEFLPDKDYDEDDQ